MKISFGIGIGEAWQAIANATLYEPFLFDIIKGGACHSAHRNHRTQSHSHDCKASLEFIIFFFHVIALIDCGTEIPSKRDSFVGYSTNFQRQKTNRRHTCLIDKFIILVSGIACPLFILPAQSHYRVTLQTQPDSQCLG
ncbi:hypothetical protein D9M71_565360 [compost metagenome]